MTGDTPTDPAGSAVAGTRSHRDSTERVLGGLYDGFEAYRTPTEGDYSSLLEGGMVVLDTNVLIDLYRYHRKTRDDFITVLRTLTERLWLPNQVIKEFWDVRDNIIDDPREADKTAKDLRKQLSTVNGGLRHWAKRVRLPENYMEELSFILAQAFDKVIGQVERLAVDDGREFARDPNNDPLIMALEPIVAKRVGPPFVAAEYERAISEAQRRGKKRIPPGYIDMGREGAGRPGDYLIWAQLLAEAKLRRQDVLFVTADDKEDWWRKDKNNNSLGPRPELVEELKSNSGVRLFMLPPDSLLDHAREALRIPVSEESVEDVKQTSRQTFEREREGSVSSSTSAFREYLLYEEEVKLAILGMGYDVQSVSRDIGFDLAVRDSDGRVIYIELKITLTDRPLPSVIVRQLSEQAQRAVAPALLVTNMRIGHQADAYLRDSANLDFVVWRERADDDALQHKLSEIFARN